MLGKIGQRANKREKEKVKRVTEKEKPRAPNRLLLGGPHANSNVPRSSQYTELLPMAVPIEENLPLGVSSLLTLSPGCLGAPSPGRPPTGLVVPAFRLSVLFRGGESNCIRRENVPRAESINDQVECRVSFIIILGRYLVSSK